MRRTRRIRTTSTLRMPTLCLGYFDTMSEVTQLVNYKPRTNAFEWYTQDQWQATKKLLLDYGIRYSWAMAQKLSAGNNFAPSLYTAVGCADSVPAAEQHELRRSDDGSKVSGGICRPVRSEHRQPEQRRAVREHQGISRRARSTATGSCLLRASASRSIRRAAETW